MTVESRVSLAAADSDAALAEAEAIFRRDGVVVLDDLVDPALITQCRKEIEAGYPHLSEVDQERNFGTYPGRHTTPIRVEGIAADRTIFLPKPILKLAARLLGKEFELDSMGVLVSLPGAPDQTRHSDALLFGDQGTDCLLPPFAFAFVLPLVPMDEISGTTAFWRGSHRKPRMEGNADFAPMVQPGSALLWDFRVQHRGLANRSGGPRPVLFSVLCRDWWRETVALEAVRYEKLTIAGDLLEDTGPAMRRILRRAKVSVRQGYEHAEN